MSDTFGTFTIHNLAAADRPRERFMAQGASALTSAELLAILIGSGVPGESSVALMQRVLCDCRGSLSQLGKMSIEQLMKYNGIGPAKAITILAACELGRRRMLENVEREPIRSSADLFTYFRSFLMDKTCEHAVVLALDAKLHPLGHTIVTVGGTASASIDVRQVLREALRYDRATRFAFCHNHPSGSPTPSRQDDQLTEQLKRASLAIQMPMIDHIILGENEYYSYSDSGKM